MNLGNLFNNVKNTVLGWFTPQTQKSTPAPHLQTQAEINANTQKAMAKESAPYDHMNSQLDAMSTKLAPYMQQANYNTDLIHNYVTGKYNNLGPTDSQGFHENVNPYTAQVAPYAQAESQTVTPQAPQPDYVKEGQEALAFLQNYGSGQMPPATPQQSIDTSSFHQAAVNREQPTQAESWLSKYV